jgi:hypothetical protein
MIKFDKPENLDGAELLNELNAAGVIITEPPTIDENQDFWLNIASTNKIKTAAIVAAHKGTPVAPDNSAAKAAVLAKLGITADEAKLLLG